MARLSETVIINDVIDARRMYKEKSEELIRKFIEDAKINGKLTNTTQLSPEWSLTTWCWEDQNELIYIECNAPAWHMCICMRIDLRFDGFDCIKQAANCIAYICEKVTNEEDARIIQEMHHLILEIKNEKKN